MLKDDIDLVAEMTAKYGILRPVIDLGGLKCKDVTLADYTITLNGGSQMDRYLHLNKDPLADIFGEYRISNPDYGDPFIEDMPDKDYWGTVTCLSVLEHVENPFRVFENIYAQMVRGGLFIASTFQSFPIHSAPRDFWRYSDECFKYLAKMTGFTVLEAGYRVDIHGGMGILNIQDMKTPQEIRSTYIACRK